MRRRDPGVPGRYSVYIPDNFEPCSPGVLILTPNGTSAQSFLETGQGQNWLGVCAACGIAAVVAVSLFRFMKVSAQADSA